MKMHAVTTVPSTVPTFEVLLDKMMPHFRYYAGKVLCLRMDNFDDALQELTVLAYEFYRTLVRKGKDIFYTPIMRFAMMRYQDGRRFIGSNSVDALSDRTKIRGRSKVCAEDTLYSLSDQKANVAQSIGFKIDFDDWYHQQSPKDKSIIRDLAMGEMPSDIAKKHGQSPTSITYRRQYYAKSWDNYTVDKFEGGIA
jgi:hypothetical protein